MRKLASIQTILEIIPIEGADFIEQARILGWSMVIKKGEFAVGDHAIMFEIDSVLPDTPTFEFMRRSRFRVKTMKMKKVLAQGLALPLKMFPFLPENLEVGTDVSELLGVTKYQPAEDSSVGGVPGGNFPGYVSKTDETRIQSVPTLIEELSGVPCYVSVKMDGCSASYVVHDGEALVCSRNMTLTESDTNVHWIIERRHGILNKLDAQGGSWAVQGEICGPKIQANRLGLTAHEFYAFNVYNIETGQYLDFVDFRKFCECLGIKTVPIEIENFSLAGHTVDSLLEMARGKYVSGHAREGIVIRPRVEQFSNLLHGRASFKAINNEFLLKGGED